MRLSELLGVPVSTEAGERLGHVHDVRAELAASSLRVTGLVVGGLGLVERLGFGAPTSPGGIRSRDVVAWADVLRRPARGRRPGPGRAAVGGAWPSPNRASWPTLPTS